MRGLWTHLERLGAGRGVGGIGTRGPGESQIETDRRLARDRITALRRQLDACAPRARRMRAERERAHLPTVALAGYTNAGKSTLLNGLTGAEVGVRDRLFHTLDPTTRTLRLEGRTYLLTDTVGFIRKLPHQLVEAFGATLEETSAPTSCCTSSTRARAEEELAAMTRAVEDVLEEIGTGDQPRVLVLNKADALDDERRRELAFRHPDAVLVSALDRRGPRRARRADRRRVRAHAARRRAARAVLRGRHALRAARLRRRPRARGHRRRRARHARGCPPSSPSATTATRSTATATARGAASPTPGPRSPAGRDAGAAIAAPRAWHVMVSSSPKRHGVPMSTEPPARPRRARAAFVVALASRPLGLPRRRRRTALADGEKDEQGYSHRPELLRHRHARTSARTSTSTSTASAPSGGADDRQRPPRGRAATATPVFVGIARTRDVRDYLRDVDHAVVKDINTHPFRADYRERAGGPPAPPTSATSGTPRRTAPLQTLTWDVRDGDWSVVVMNADGSPASTPTGAPARVGFLDEAGWVCSEVGGPRRRRVRR